MNNTLILSKAHHIELSGNDRRQHVLITGKPSTGVTTFFTDLILQDISKSGRVIVFDPYGDIADKILGDLTEDQLKQTVYADIGNKEYPIGLNLFQAVDDDDRREVANTVINLIYTLYDPNRTGIIGPRFDHAVRNAVMTILYDEKSTFIELVRCLTDKAYVDKILPKIKDPLVKNYWTKQIAQTSDFHKSEVLDYVVSKFGRFVTDSKIRNIVGQSETSLDLKELIDKKSILIFELSKLRSDNEAMKIVSEILLLKLNIALKNRADKSEPVALYMDEVENYSGGKLVELLRTGRMQGVNLTLITQRIADTESILRKELLRTGTLVAFRLSTDNATIIAPEFHKNISPDRICMLKKYHMFVRTLKEGNPVVYEEINNELPDLKPISRSPQEITTMKLEKTKEFGVHIVKAEAEIAKRLI